MARQTAGVRSISTLRPPLVDIRCFHEDIRTNFNDDQRHKAAHAAGKACRTHGLLAVPFRGGIAPEIAEEAFVSVKRLFALPLERKLELALTDLRENVGYIQQGNEAPDPNQIAPDPKEVFQFQPGKRALPKELEEPLEALFYAGMAAGRATLRALSRSLDLPDDETFARAASNLDLCSLRAIHYPGGVEPLANRCGAHSDFGMCSLLLNEHGGAPGLQAADNVTGEWRNVEAPDGAEQGGAGVAFVNLGDMLARWTNDEVVSTRHRVVAPATPADAARSRFVIALFCDADGPTSLEPLPQFVSVSRPAKYPRQLAGDFKAMRLAGQTTI